MRTTDVFIIASTCLFIRLSYRRRRINASPDILPHTRIDVDTYDTGNDSTTLLTAVRLLEEPLQSGAFAESFNLIGILGHVRPKMIIAMP